jgi:AcrR family transcriptional regulator
MPRSAGQTKARILNEAYTLFRRKGYSRVGIDEVAAAAAVTKRTLYYHFSSKDELLAAVLESQHALALAAFQAIIDKCSGPPERIVAQVFEQLESWSAKPRWSGSGFTRLVMELADLPGHPARAIARRHKAIIEAEFAERLAKAGLSQPRERAREIWILLEGVMALLLIHGDRGYITAGARAAKKLVMPPRRR